MDIQAFFILWKDIGLLLYATLKAFLPLPSLEVMLIPLCLSEPHKWLLYAVEGSIGTFVGGGIGYFIAYKMGRKALVHIASDEDIRKGETLMERYGLWAVFIGGITPIPDFLLAYLAGFTRMNFIAFASCDAFARFLRSILVTYGVFQMGTILDVDRFGTMFSLSIMGLLLLRWIYQKLKLHYSTSKK